MYDKQNQSHPTFDAPRCTQCDKPMVPYLDETTQFGDPSTRWALTWGCTHTTTYIWNEQNNE